MPRKQAQKKIRGARQVARPGICYELPIVIEEDEVAQPINTTAPKPTVMFEDILLGAYAPKVHGPPKRDGKPQGSRKRARQCIDDNDEDAKAGDGAKRPRLSGEASFQDERGFDHCTPSPARQPQSVLQSNLSTMWCEIDRQRARERETRLQNEAERSREAELRDHQSQYNFQANISAMRRDWDRQRDAAEQLRRDRERERQVDVQVKSQEQDNERLREISGLETSLRTMWETQDLAQGRAIRPGQLSERGQRRVREREELRRRGH